MDNCVSHEKTAGTVRGLLTSSAHHRGERSLADCRQHNAVLETGHAQPPLKMLRQLADSVEDANVAWVDGRRASDEDATFEVYKFVGLVGEAEAGINLIWLESAILVRNADEDVRIGQRDASSLLEVAETATPDDLERAAEERFFVQDAVDESGEGGEGADETARPVE